MLFHAYAFSWLNPMSIKVCSSDIFSLCVWDWIFLVKIRKRYRNWLVVRLNYPLSLFLSANRCPFFALRCACVRQQTASANFHGISSDAR